MDERDALRKTLAGNPKMARELQAMLEQSQLKVADRDATEPLMVICKRWPGLVDACRMALCSFCGSEIALAPSSQEMIDKSVAPVQFCCMECMADGALREH